MHWDVSNKMLFILADDRSLFISCILLFIKFGTFHIWCLSLTYHNSWNISTVFSLYFVKFLFVSCSDRNLAVLWGYCQPRNPFFFSLVLLVLDLEMGRCPPPYYSFWGHLPSLLLFLKLTSSVTYSTIVVTHLQVQYPQFIGSLAYCHFPTTFLI